jgi:hypothetical protein
MRFRGDPTFHEPFLTESKCPRIYYSDFNYRNRVGIKAIRKGDLFFDGGTFYRRKTLPFFCST